ncbi:MAG: head decoration protein [Clostridia bacterium]|nr:head decoration protein [Clostridia bacterium]
MKEHGKKIGEMEFDGLITDITPRSITSAGIIGKTAEETTFKRGTLFGKNENGVLSLYDGSGTPDCILCEDTVVGTAEDVSAAVYIAGCFDPAKLTVKDGYVLTEADKTKLRQNGIILKSAAKAE